jgi:hypothetical protein
MFYGYWIYDGRYYMFGTRFLELGVLHIWLWLMAFNVKRGEAMCIYCTSFLPYLEATTFTILLALFLLLWLVAPQLCSAFGEKIVVLFSFLAFFLQVCWLLSLHSWIVSSAPDKIILLALRVCMQNVFVFQSLQWICCGNFGRVTHISIWVSSCWHLNVSNWKYCSTFYSI